MGPELIAKLGLNKDKYSRGLQEAERDFRDFTSKTAGHGKSAAEQLTHSFRGVHELLKAFGAITVIREFINQFKELSDYAKEFGDRTDTNIKGAIRWGEAWKSVTESTKSAAAKSLGFFATLGYAAGGALKGESPAQIAKDAASDDAANEAEAKRDAYKKANPEEELKRLRKEIAEITKATYSKQMTDEQKVSELEQEQLRLQKEKAELGEHETKKRLEIEKEIAANGLKFSELAKKQQEDLARTADERAKKEEEEHAKRKARIEELKQQELSAAEKVQELQARVERGKQDRSRLSVQELANIGKFQPGVSSDVADAAEKDRQAISLRNQADQLRLSGDQTGAAALQSQSDAILHSLAGPGGPLKHSEDPDQSQLIEELSTANKHLEDIDSKISALTTSQ